MSSLDVEDNIRALGKDGIKCMEAQPLRYDGIEPYFTGTEEQLRKLEAEIARLREKARLHKEEQELIAKISVLRGVQPGISRGSWR